MGTTVEISKADKVNKINLETQKVTVQKEMSRADALLEVYACIAAGRNFSAVGLVSLIRPNKAETDAIVRFALYKHLRPSIK